MNYKFYSPSRKSKISTSPLASAGAKGAQREQALRSDTHNPFRQHL